jgi:hypothetical protein
MLSASRPVVIDPPARVDIENVTKRPERLAEPGGVWFIMRLPNFDAISRSPA